MEQKKKILIIVGSIMGIAVLCLVLFLIFNKNEAKYTVVFNSGEDSNITEQIIKLGELVRKPINPTREGYIFIEWQYEGKTFDFSSEIDEDITLQAKWQKINTDVETYIIQFDTDGGTTISNQVLEINEKVEKPDDPVKSGYIFKGWYVGNEEFDFNSTIIENITITAKWEKEITYIVTFNSNNGTTVKSQKVVSGKTAVKPTNPVRTGYVFTDWKLDGNVYNFNAAVTADLTLTATWTKAYTVTFDSNGGSNIATHTIATGQKVTQPSNPTREGYIFKGWNLNDSEFNFNTAITADITLKAVWEENTYSVTYYDQGVEDKTSYSGSSIAEVSNSYTYGVGLTLPTELTKTGYTFDGWYTAYNAGDKVTAISDSDTEDKTFYAKWKPIEYTIAFDGNGADNQLTSPMSNLTCTYGADCTLTSNTYVKTGYVFLGWATESNAETQKYDNGKKVLNLTDKTETKTLYAVWKQTEAVPSPTT